MVCIRRNCTGNVGEKVRVIVGGPGDREERLWAPFGRPRSANSVGGLNVVARGEARLAEADKRGLLASDAVKYCYAVLCILNSHGRNLRTARERFLSVSFSLMRPGSRKARAEEGTLVLVQSRYLDAEYPTRARFYSRDRFLTIRPHRKRLPYSVLREGCENAGENSADAE